MSKYTPVIGLEIHIEQNTNSKMFCECPADHFSKEPNTQTCPVCLGLPGALPYPNHKAIENTIKFGLAFGCSIASESKFDRKHYYYPDLPKGYQISQYDLPLCCDGEFKEVRIRRIHLEEDTAKSVHTTVNGKKATLVDFNRSGVPLIELVTEPDFHDPETVDIFLKEIQLIVRSLGISSADMEKGSMRLEANISIKHKDATELPDYKVELKNINSFRYLKSAIVIEIERQTEILEKGERPVQETRGYDEKSNLTFSQRTKEDAQDYRYFPEPDIPPLSISKHTIESIKDSMPELPEEKRNRYMSSFDMPSHFVDVLVENASKAEYFDAAVTIGNKHSIPPKTIADVIVNQNLENKYPEPSGLIRKLVEMTQKKFSDNEETEAVVMKVVSENQDAVESFRNGKEQIIGFLIGQVQKELKGNGDPKLIQTLLRQNLKN